MRAETSAELALGAPIGQGAARETEAARRILRRGRWAITASVAVMIIGFAIGQPLSRRRILRQPGSRRRSAFVGGFPYCDGHEVEWLGARDQQC